MLRRLVTLLALLLPTAALAETALVAVAANFATTVSRLAGDYAAASGDTVEVTTGSTGKLYAQIAAGAPFDAMLSADEATPERLAGEGHGTPVPYANGLLALWVPGALPGADPARTLAGGAVRHVAIANPDLAPYGRAAVAAIGAMGLGTVLQDRIVIGENVGQAHAMVASGAAEAGFVAASALDGAAKGLVWIVAPNLYPPIRQDAILLSHGKGNAAAEGFLAYLVSPAARRTIAAAGYGLPQ